MVYFCRFIQIWAGLNLLFVLMSVVFPLTLGGAVYHWQNANVLIIVQALVSLAMMYSATQRVAGRDIGYKTLPASVVSYLLWLGMLRFWLFSAG